MICLIVSHTKLLNLPHLRDCLRPYATCAIGSDATCAMQAHWSFDHNNVYCVVVAWLGRSQLWCHWSKWHGDGIGGDMMGYQTRWCNIVVEKNNGWKRKKTKNNVGEKGKKIWHRLTDQEARIKPNSDGILK